MPEMETPLINWRDYPERCYYHGKRWTRYPRAIRDSDRNYYRRNIRNRTVYLHRYVWEQHNIDIPEGFHIHHIDGNYDNNDISNLQMLTPEEHMRLHFKGWCSDRKKAHLDNVRPMTKEWHRSEEGREWHRKHARIVADNMKPKEATCQLCGEKYMSKLGGTCRSKFCSDRCRAEARRRSGVDDVQYICVGCGCSFLKSKYSSIPKYCSRKCFGECRKKQTKLKKLLSI